MINKGSHKSEEYFGAQHRFEHWYCDNIVYFITAHCRNQTHAFADESCKAIFWDRFDHYTAKYGFVPFVVSLLSNHYHALGYLKVGQNLGPMMKGIHGSVAKLVNDRRGQRLTPFWVDSGHQNYFDGCIRNETKCRPHGICERPENYAHTRRHIALEQAVQRTLELNAFLTGVPYKRYAKKRTT